VASSRAVRIPRPRPAPAAAASPAAPSTPAPSVEKAEIRRNQAANERAQRLLMLYLGTLLVLYVAFLLLDRSSPGGTSSTAETGMIYFSVIAAILAVGGVWVALSPVPRSVEVRPASVVVVEWWGKRRRFPPLGELRPGLVRKFPRSILSSRAVETLEITDDSGRRRTYQLEEGLLPETVREPR
jgi:hypothetical protein